MTCILCFGNHLFVALAFGPLVVSFANTEHYLHLAPTFWSCLLYAIQFLTLVVSRDPWADVQPSLAFSETDGVSFFVVHLADMVHVSTASGPYLGSIYLVLTPYAQDDLSVCPAPRGNQGWVVWQSSFICSVFISLGPLLQSKQCAVP